MIPPRRPSSRVIYVALALLFMGIGFLGAVLLAKNEGWAAVADTRGKIIRNGKYDMINPILLCEIGKYETAFPELLPIKNNLQKLVDELLQEKKIQNVSVYVRMLNSGRWVGINDTELFSPASLTKVVVMIAILKRSEAHPNFLKKQILYDGSFDYDQLETIQNSQPLLKGRSYSIEALLENMIIHSGNNALLLLREQLDREDPNFLTSVFNDLMIPPLKSPGSDYVLSSSEYSVAFRILYNATYLERNLSDLALNLLRRAEFKDGLMAGVPSNITVAHKFGERVIRDEGITEFHDCGIVYYPDHPYFLCVMTQGRNFPELISAVKNISKLAYEKIDLFFKNLAKAKK